MEESIKISGEKVKNAYFPAFIFIYISSSVCICFPVADRHSLPSNGRTRGHAGRQNIQGLFIWTIFEN